MKHNKKDRIMKVLPDGVVEEIAEMFNVSASHAKSIIYEDWAEERYPANEKLKDSIRREVARRFPSFFEPDTFFLVSVLMPFTGVKEDVAVCSTREDCNRVVEIFADIVMKSNVVVREFSPNKIAVRASKLFSLPIEEESDIPEGHLIEDLKCDDAKVFSTIKKYLTEKQGCRTLEDAAEIPPEDVAKFRLMSKNAIKVLVSLFEENGVPYDKEGYSKIIY